MEAIVPTSMAKPSTGCQKKDTDYGGGCNPCLKNPPPRAETWQKCADLCHKHSNCLYWSWTDSTFKHNKMIHKCFLKGQTTGLAFKKGVTSGSKKCIR